MSGQTTQTAEVLDGQELDRVKETAIKGLLALIKIEADDTTYMRGIETGRMNRERFTRISKKMKQKINPTKMESQTKNISSLMQDKTSQARNRSQISISSININKKNKKAKNIAQIVRHFSQKYKIHKKNNYINFSIDNNTGAESNAPVVQMVGHQPQKLDLLPRRSPGSIPGWSVSASSFSNLNSGGTERQ